MSYISRVYATRNLLLPTKLINNKASNHSNYGINNSNFKYGIKPNASLGRDIHISTTWFCASDEGTCQTFSRRMSTLNSPVEESKVKPKVKKKRRKKKFKNFDELTEQINASFKQFQSKNDRDALFNYKDPVIAVPPKLHEKVEHFFNSKEKPYTVTSDYSVEMLEDLDISFAEHDANDHIHEILPLRTEELEIESNDVISPTSKAKSKKQKTSKKSRKQAKVVEDKELNMKRSLEEKKVQLEIKDELLKLSLKPYLAVCVRSGMIGPAHSVLQNIRSKTNRLSLYKDLNVNYFNIVLGGWGTKRNFKKVYEVFNWLKEDGIMPNEQTYVILLETLSDMTRRWQLKFTKRILSHMEANGIQPESIFNSAKFVGDHKERILKSIKQVRPNFVPQDIPEPKKYTGRLLKNLLAPPGDNVHYDVFGESISRDDLRLELEKQLAMEKNGQTVVESIAKSNKEENHIKEMRKLCSTCEETWKKTLLQSFIRNVNNLKRHSGSQKMFSIYPYLTILKPEVFADIMLQEVRKLAESSETFSPVLSYLYKMIATRVMNRYLIIEKEHAEVDKKVKVVCQDYFDYLLDPQKAARKNHREQLEELKNIHSNGPSLDNDLHIWPNHVLTSIGKFLYDILIHEIKIDVNIFKNDVTTEQIIPAFYNIYRNNGLYVKEEIKPHPLLVKLYSEAESSDLIFDCNLLPMVVPPLPWSLPRSGGYLLTSVPFIRLNENTLQQWRLPEDIDSQQLLPVFDSLNQLGGCAWIINRPVLDIIIKVFNDKGSDQLDIPRPSSECPALPKFTKEMNKSEKFKINRVRMGLKRKKSDMYSLWCDTLYKLSIANHFRDKVFWFPHNLDFRGRVYPCPPHFNHLGSDVTRSMLLFAKGKPLGKDGLNWLKIHAVNLTGLKKKETIDGRLKYANEILPEMIKSADHPLMENSWWMESDEPWQTLACCMEIAKAERSPDPTKYICHFPVHQDGSCNGLQHYAALGRDQEGAEQVNLYPSDSPQDVYSGVAALVEIERKKDAADGNKTAQVLEGFVNRRVVKQTVMTVVYGVTRYGARLQILKQLKDIPEFPQEHSHLAAHYLVAKTFYSIQQMFSTTRKIQDWFTECARQITQVRSKPIEWVTPLGLPVIQPYHKASFTKFSSGLPEPMRVLYSGSSKLKMKPNVMKQKNAFPPNYIHSLDSTHMMLTSLYCLREGISFVSVHDCFWTHPNTVDIMNKICREQFVALHQEPLLENLSKFLVDRFSFSDSPGLSGEKQALNETLISVPQPGKFKLEGILKSVYFFS